LTYGHPLSLFLPLNPLQKAGMWREPLMIIDTPQGAQAKQFELAGTTYPKAVPDQNPLSAIAVVLSAWMERWFPDSFVFVVLAVILSALGAILIGAPAQSIPQAFGNGFWDLIPFTLQASLVVIGGYVVASSPLASRVISWLAAIPRSGPSAVAFIALVSCISSLFNWAFSLVFGALLVKEMARRHKSLDYRAASAAAILGLGSVWAVEPAANAPEDYRRPALQPDDIFVAIDRDGCRSTGGDSYSRLLLGSSRSWSDDSGRSRD
jgi:hypothetical protein